MAVLQKNLYGNDNAPNTLTTAYTVPASTSTIVTCITIANKTASSVGITILINGYTLTVKENLLTAYSTTVIELKRVMNSAAQIIQVQASAASSLAITIDGVEVT